MLNQIMKHVRDLPSWVVSPASLIDRLLDHLDKLHSFVLPAAVNNPSYRYVKVEARRRRFGE